MDDEKHTCPRRCESFFGPIDTSDEPATDTWKIYPEREKRSCSYCGSMHPNDLFFAIDAGDEIGPTDKNYKIYVGAGSKYKFYLQHLNNSERLRFIDFINSGKMRIGYPGHFYVMPFFIRSRT